MLHTNPRSPKWAKIIPFPKTVVKSITIEQTLSRSNQIFGHNQEYIHTLGDLELIAGASPIKMELDPFVDGIVVPDGYIDMIHYLYETDIDNSPEFANLVVDVVVALSYREMTYNELVKVVNYHLATLIMVIKQTD